MIDHLCFDFLLIDWVLFNLICISIQDILNINFRTFKVVFVTRE